MNANQHPLKELRASTHSEFAGTPVAKTVQGSADELLRELQKRQIELEQQQETLRRAYTVLEKSHNHYRQLYEFAPVAYLTLTEEGCIEEVNLATLTLLGIEREKVLQRRFADFVSATDGERWRFFCDKVFKQNQQQTIDLLLKTAAGNRIYTQLDCLPVIVDKQLTLRLILTNISQLKQAELIKSLKESEALLRNILDASQAIVYMKDLEGRYIHINRRYKDVFHFSTERVIGKTDYDLFPQAIADGFRKNDLIVIGSGAPVEVEEQAPHADGDLHTYLSIKVPLRNTADEVYAICGISTDITERKKIELEKEQFFKFFNFARDLQCIAGHDGFFKQVNPAFSETLGYSKEQLLQRPFLEFVLPEDRQKTLTEIAKQLDNKVTIAGNQDYLYLTIDFENRYLCQNGEICWLSWKAIFNPSDALIYATARDVTEFKKIEEKLQLANLVYQNSIEAVLVTDANNQIIAANPAFTEITGYSLDEVLGKNPKVFQSSLHSAEFYQSMWKSIENHGQWQGEIWDKRKNGELHAKFLNINTIFNKQGQVHRYLALFSDITARKQYEEEIKRLSDSELNKAKLEAEKANLAKSDFLSSMSHELRTPMNAVLGFAQLLESEALTAEQLDSVKEILTAAHHLMDLINEVLDLSKIESEHLELSLEKIDLNALLKNCLSLMQPMTLKNNITLRDNLQTLAPFSVIADSVRFKQVLLNLLSNAIKYNCSGGSVSISCEVVNPQSLRINVIDTGKGLSEAQMAKLFQPFERLSAKNSNIEGTGIGLCISKKLMEAMNGRIGVKSSVGKGCCFWVEIPLA